MPVSNGPDNNLTPIDIGRLLDRDPNGAGDRFRRNRELVPGGVELSLYLRICHCSHEIRIDETRRNDRHAQLVAGFLAQPLGDGAHGDFVPE